MAADAPKRTKCARGWSEQRDGRREAAGGSPKKSSKVHKKNTMPTLSFFHNIRQEIRQRLDAATQNIDVAMAWLTNADLWQSLCNAQRRGVKVRLIVAQDATNENCGIDYQELQKIGGIAYLKDMSNLGLYSKMHNKFCIIDQKITITGSYNWTNQAPMNAENIVVIDDAQIASNYILQFEQLIADLINIQHIDSDSLNFVNAYGNLITRKAPTALVILLDQSGSMGETTDYEGQKITKSSLAARFVNQILSELIMKCTKDDGLRNYIDVAIIGYGEEVGAAWQNGDSTNNWRSINDLYSSSATETITKTLKVRGVEREIEEQVKTWISARADGLTPMGEALQQTKTLLKTWISAHSESFPPVIINISDGNATDIKGDALIDIANQIKSLYTNNGHILLFNCHIGDGGGQVCQYPRDKSDLSGDALGALLLEMSSLLPSVFYPNCKKDIPNFDEKERYYAMFQNVAIGQMLRILQVGTSHI
jgi:hypothetical protein